MQCVAACCSVLQCVPVCCSAFQCVAMYCSVLQYQQHGSFVVPFIIAHVQYIPAQSAMYTASHCNNHTAMVCCSLLQCVAVRIQVCTSAECGVRCETLQQCVATCCSVL